MTDARTLTHSLGGHWKNGRGQAPCPICQPERRRDQVALSISQQGVKLLLYCFKSHCSFVDIAQSANLPLGEAQIHFETLKETERKQADSQAAKLAKARSLWNAAKPIAGTRADAYLRGRGITCDLPDSLRFMPDIYHAPSASWTCAMLADVSTGGVHRTYFDKRGARLTKSAKMMLGPCAEGAVRLSQGAGPLMVCEGIETGLSVLQIQERRNPTVWAALSTSGVKGLTLPQEPGELIVCPDGDDAGAEAANVLAREASAQGWNVKLLPAPDGHDWNDVLCSGVAA